MECVTLKPAASALAPGERHTEALAALDAAYMAREDRWRRVQSWDLRSDPIVRETAHEAERQYQAAGLNYYLACLFGLYE